MHEGTIGSGFERLLAAAELLFNQRRVDDAAVLYAHIVESRCGGGVEAEAHHALGVIALGQNRLSDSATHLMDAIKLNPRHVDAMFYGARLQVMQGQKQEAIETLRKILEIDQLHGPARAKLAELGVALDASIPSDASMPSDTWAPVKRESELGSNEYGQWTYFINRPAPGQELLAGQVRVALEAIRGTLRPCTSAVFGFFLSEMLSFKSLAKLGAFLWFLFVFSLIAQVFAHMSTGDPGPPTLEGYVYVAPFVVLVGAVAVWLLWLYSASFASGNRYAFEPDGRLHVDAGVFSRRRLIVDIARVREVMVSSAPFQSDDGNLVLEMVDRERITLIGCGKVVALQQWQAKVQILMALLKRVQTGGIQY